MRMRRLKIAIMCGLGSAFGLPHCLSDQPRTGRTAAQCAQPDHVHKAVLWRDLRASRTPASPHRSATPAVGAFASGRHQGPAGKQHRRAGLPGRTVRCRPAARTRDGRRSRGLRRGTPHPLPGIGRRLYESAVTEEIESGRAEAGSQIARPAGDGCNGEARRYYVQVPGEQFRSSGTGTSKPRAFSNTMASACMV